MQHPPEFIQIPYQVIADRNLRPLDRIVYGVVYWFHSLKDGKCTAGNQRIGEIACCTVSGVQHSLNRLEEAGYIRRTYKDEDRKVRKQIVPLVVYKRVRTNEHTVRTNEHTTYGQMSTRIRKGKEEKKRTQHKGEQSSLIPEVIKSFEKIDRKNKTYYGNTTQREACAFLIEEHGLETVQGVIENVLPKTNKRPRYEFPHISTPHQLKENWSKLSDSAQMKQQEKLSKNKVAFK